MQVEEVVRLELEEAGMEVLLGLDTEIMMVETDVEEDDKEEEVGEEDMGEKNDLYVLLELD